MVVVEHHKGIESNVQLRRQFPDIRRLVLQLMRNALISVRFKSSRAAG